LVVLELGVAVDRDGDGLAGLARGEVDGAAGRDVVAVGRGRRAVGGREVGRAAWGGRGGQAVGGGGRRGDGGDLVVGQVGRGGEQRSGVVVGDGAGGRALAGGDGGVRRAGQHDADRLVGLELGVAVDHDGDGLAGLARREGHRAAGGVVVAVARGRRAVGGR